MSDANEPEPVSDANEPEPVSDDVIDGPARIEVVAGGTPSPEQLAAVVVALTPVAAPAEAPTGRGGEAEVPAWARAALLESVEERRIAAPAALRAPGGPA
ncbi:hypothetical protein FTX61_11225 [Nitriliruptoraceae bacterium ZYF776]|nr:hypothetical protein [Profundirhabdus halotolerans]